MARAQRKQQQIPGTEPVSIPELDEAALEYAVARDKRIAANQVEKTKLGTLTELLKKHNLDVYRFETDEGEAMRVEKVPTKIKIKVRKVKDGDSDADAEVDPDDDSGDGDNT